MGHGGSQVALVLFHLEHAIRDISLALMALATQSHAGLWTDHYNLISNDLNFRSSEMAESTHGS